MRGGIRVRPRSGLLLGASAVLVLFLTGPATAGEKTKSPDSLRKRLEEALGAAREGDVVRAARIAREALGGMGAAEPPGDLVGQLRASFEARARELVPALEEGAADRASAAWALGWIGYLEAWRRIAGMLFDPEPGVRSAAARALGLMGARDSSSALLRSALDEDAAVREAVLDALRGLGAGWDAAVSGLSDASPGVRSAAAHLLAVVPPDALRPDPAGKALVRALGDHSAMVRASAALALGRLRPRGAVDALRAAALDPNVMVAATAVDSLGDIGEEALPALLDLAGSGRPVAVRAVKELARTGALSAVVERLARLLEEAPRETAAAAAEALGTLGGETAGRALAAGSARKDVRVAVAVAAARLGEFGPAGQLLRDLDDPDPWVRLAAARGLAETGNPAGFGAFLDALTSEDDRVRLYAAACLSIFTHADIEYSAKAPARKRGGVAGAWRRWWLENRRTFVIPRRDSGAAR